MAVKSIQPLFSQLNPTLAISKRINSDAVWHEKPFLSKIQMMADRIILVEAEAIATSHSCNSSQCR
ncbi:MAG TPA: hypothetical protein VK203_20960 [Nostocaceae cyanobacterium]|nr:hypothetical protein [Nostocaceae cyanobacterium]